MLAQLKTLETSRQRLEAAIAMPKCLRINRVHGLADSDRANDDSFVPTSYRWFMLAGGRLSDAGARRRCSVLQAENSIALNRPDPCNLWPK